MYDKIAPTVVKPRSNPQQNQEVITPFDEKKQL